MSVLNLVQVKEIMSATNTYHKARFLHLLDYAALAEIDRDGSPGREGAKINPHKVSNPYCKISGFYFSTPYNIVCESRFLGGGGCSIIDFPGWHNEIIIKRTYWKGRTPLCSNMCALNWCRLRKYRSQLSSGH